MRGVWDRPKGGTSGTGYRMVAALQVGAEGSGPALWQGGRSVGSRGVLGRTARRDPSNLGGGSPECQAFEIVPVRFVTRVFPASRAVEPRFLTPCPAYVNAVAGAPPQVRQ